MNRVEFAHALFENRRHADYHDEFRELRRLKTYRSDLNPTLCAKCRVPEKHYRHEHYQVENVKFLAVLLQSAIIEVHEQHRNRRVDERENSLPLHEPKSLFAGRVDVRCA